MNGIHKYFTAEEIEEIAICKDGTAAMSVEGKAIICFDVLHQLINENIPISMISKKELLTAYAQMKGFKEAIYSVGLVDTSLLERILEKSKKLFIDEINSRKYDDCSDILEKRAPPKERS